MATQADLRPDGISKRLVMTVQPWHTLAEAIWNIISHSYSSLKDIHALCRTARWLPRVNYGLTAERDLKNVWPPPHRKMPTTTAEYIALYREFYSEPWLHVVREHGFQVTINPAWDLTPTLHGFLKALTETEDWLHQQYAYDDVLLIAVWLGQYMERDTLDFHHFVETTEGFIGGSTVHRIAQVVHALNSPAAKRLRDFCDFEYFNSYAKQLKVLGDRGLIDCGDQNTHYRDAVIAPADALIHMERMYTTYDGTRVAVFNAA